MKNLLFVCLAVTMLFAGCGEDSDPTRNNDFVPLTGITITSEFPRVPAGFTNQFTATGDFSGAFTRDITTEVTWSSSDTNILTFDNPNSGLGRSIAPGSVTVTAQRQGVLPATFQLRTDAQLTAITVTPDPVSLPKGRQQKFEASGTLDDGTPLANITRNVAWTSSNIQVATVDATGLASAIAVGGPIEIRAGFGSAQDPASLTVTAAVVDRIEVTPADVLLTSGETQQYAATAVFSDGATSTVANATWSSADTRVATISTTGLATAVANGATTISALDPVSQVTGTTNVTVATIIRIDITPANPTIDAGEQVELTATATLSNGSTQDITSIATWEAEPTTIAGVEAGVVTGFDSGRATITATKNASGTTTVTVR